MDAGTTLPEQLGCDSPSPGFCTADHWCWVDPQPVGGAFTGLDGAASNDVWAAADGGFLAHWDGTAWTQVPGGPAADVNRAWRVRAFGPDDVWVVGPEDARHWDGATWTRRPKVSSSGSREEVSELWADAPDDVWVAGEGGVIGRWTGSAWLDVASPTTERIVALGGAAPDDVWIATLEGRVFHWDGATWTSTDALSAAPRLNVQAFAVLSPDNVWAVAGNRTDAGRILHWDGAHWTSAWTSNASLDALWAQRPDDVWAAGLNGTLVHWDGSGWTKEDGGTSDGLVALWGSAADDVWAGGESGALLHWNGVAWAALGCHGGVSARQFTAIWGATPNDVWAGTTTDLLHWDGQRWWRTVRPDVGRQLKIWGLAVDDVWAFDERAMHWDGHRWTPASLGNTRSISAMSGTAPDDVWALSAAGTDRLTGKDERAELRHWDGTGWSATTPAAPGLDPGAAALVAVGRNDLWTAGRQQVFHWDGAAWRAMPTGFDVNFVGIDATGPDDVWARGWRWFDEMDRESRLVHWDGTRWTDRTPPLGFEFGFWLGGPHDAWAFGWSGQVVHWNGSGWESQASGARDDLIGIGGARPNAIWMFDENDGLLQYRP